MDTYVPFPETNETSAFLLNIPDDLDRKEAEERLYRYCEDFDLTKPGVMNVEWLAGMKKVLGLTELKGDTKANMVLVNALMESQRICGFNSPDMIIANIFRRRDALRETLAGAAQ